MGMLIEPHEIYFGSFLERFNMRFGPALPTSQSVWHSGGITEIAALQKEFAIFQEGRPFLQSAALLGLTGEHGGPAKDRWLEYLSRLPKMRSDNAQLNGDQRIVVALIENLQRPAVLPCTMRIYDGRTRAPGLVLVTEEAPHFQLGSMQFLTISLPMRPNPSAVPATASTTTRPPSTRTRTPAKGRAPARRKQA